MYDQEQDSRSCPPPEVVTTNQPMSYSSPGVYPGVQYVQQPEFPQTQRIEPIYHTSNTTTIIMNQQAQRHRLGYRDWSTGLCGCLEDASSCILTCCFPPCYACYLAMDMGESCCLPMCFCPGQCVPAWGTANPWLVALRVKVRESNKIQGNIMGDCCASCCCPLCVMCQLKREYDFIRRHPSDD